MADELRSKVEAAAREGIRRYMDPGYKEKRMLEQGDFAGLTAFLRQRVRTLRVVLWMTVVECALFSGILLRAALGRWIPADAHSAAILRITLVLGIVAVPTCVVVNLFLRQYSRAERCLAYSGLLSEDAEEKPRRSVR